MLLIDHVRKHDEPIQPFSAGCPIAASDQNDIIVAGLFQHFGFVWINLLDQFDRVGFTRKLEGSAFPEEDPILRWAAVDAVMGAPNVKLGTK